MKTRYWISVAWPGFLLACALELLVFAFVDPHDLRWGSEGLGASRQAVYTLCFFLFWLGSIGASALAVHLAGHPPPEPRP